MMFNFLEFPFMQRALIAGVLLAALLSYLGVFVILRKMSFFSDGIAHASLAGVAAGVLFSINPLVTALVVAVLFALGLYFLEKKTNLSSDSIIGLLFTTGMAFGVLLISFKKGYQPELLSFLFGNILTISRSDLVIIVTLCSLIGAFLILKKRQFTLLSLDREMAYLSGINPDFFQLSLNITLAVSVVLGIKMLGIVLVSALLIIPVSIAKLISCSFKKLLLRSVLFSEFIVLAGIFISYFFDLPTGAVIVLTGTALFFIVFFFRKRS